MPTLRFVLPTRSAAALIAHVQAQDPPRVAAPFAPDRDVKAPEVDSERVPFDADVFANGSQ